MRIVISCGDVNGIGLRCLAGAISMIPRDASYILAIDASTLREAAQAYQLPGTITDDVWHALASVGWPYPGQTEMVADGGHGEPLMVLSSGSVRVALTTVHVPLRDVVSALSVDRIGERIQQLHDHCRRDYGITSPSIAVLAVDPHAGDHGTIGTADTELTLPAIARAREAGMQVDGPFPADGFFAFGAYRQYDGILAMYHDQGLIPLKVLAQGGGVNTTAGIDIVRTSPDHGTAYQLAAGGLHIDARSTYEAITLACTIAAQRRTIA